MGYGCAVLPIDGQTPAVIRLPTRCWKIQATRGSLSPGTEQCEFRDQSLTQFQEHDDEPRRSYGNFKPLQQALGPTLCQSFLRPLNHDAQFVLSLLQDHLQVVVLHRPRED